MINKIDHIGIAVRSIEASSVLYRDLLGLKAAGEEIVEDQGVRVAFFHIGEAMIELLEPLNQTGPVARFLDRHGEGIHHIALRCDDIDEARSAAEAAGIRLLSDAPLDGAHGKLITFLHPRDAGGVLMELTQRNHE